MSVQKQMLPGVPMTDPREPRVGFLWRKFETGGTRCSTRGWKTRTVPCIWYFRSDSRHATLSSSASWTGRGGTLRSPCRGHRHRRPRGRQGTKHATSSTERSGQAALVLPSGPPSAGVSAPKDQQHPAEGQPGVSIEEGRTRGPLSGDRLSNGSTSLRCIAARVNSARGHFRAAIPSS